MWCLLEAEIDWNSNCLICYSNRLQEWKVVHVDLHHDSSEHPLFMRQICTYIIVHGFVYAGIFKREAKSESLMYLFSSPSLNLRKYRWPCHSDVPSKSTSTSRHFTTRSRPVRYISLKRKKKNYIAISSPQMKNILQLMSLKGYKDLEDKP